MDNFSELLSTRYLYDTKYTRHNINEPRPFVVPAPAFKSYPKAKKIPLNKDVIFSDMKLSDCLKKRRSVRRYENKPLTLNALSALLWSTQGVTGKTGEFLLRTAPSAGALYPVETYLIINNADENSGGLERGIYHYNVFDFVLEEIKTGNFSEHISDSCLGQGFLKKCPVVFVWTAVIRRCASKYTNRAMRYIMLDAGHICQNLVIACACLDLGACPVAAFFDDEANALIEVDGKEESVIYLASAGHPKE